MDNRFTDTVFLLGGENGSRASGGRWMPSSAPVRMIPVRMIRWFWRGRRGVGCGAGVSQVALWAARVVGTLDEVDRSLVRR